MAGQIGISGEQIRREQEESKQRSRRCGRPITVKPSRSLSVSVGGIEIDWLILLLTCVWLDHARLGFALAALAMGLRVVSSTVVTIQSEGDGVYATVSSPLRRRGREARIAVDEALLRLWNGWFCQSFELRGSNVSIVVAARAGSRLRPPLGVRSTLLARPSLRLSARVMALHLPNLALMGACVVLLGSGDRRFWALALWACSAIASSLANCLIGAPRLLVSRAETQRGAEVLGRDADVS